MYISDKIVQDLIAGDPKLLTAAEHFLSHCRICGEKLSEERSENVAIAVKAGPLIFHLHCADALRLSLGGHTLKEST